MPAGTYQYKMSHEYLRNYSPLLYSKGMFGLACVSCYLFNIMRTVHQVSRRAESGSGLFRQMFFFFPSKPNCSVDDSLAVVISQTTCTLGTLVPFSA